MVKHKISRLLVMEEGRLTGILTKKDIAYHIRQGEPAWRRRPVDQIPVEAFATDSPVTVVAPDTGIKTIAGIFAEKNISSVPVDGGRKSSGDRHKDGSDEILPCPEPYLSGQGRNGGCGHSQPLPFARSCNHRDERTR